ncbi:Do family serine endopeptidase [Olivibacter sitiensis]|uniref:Do family serine endopeptidase n=1 Tax=Olivibacter sitiensis TaxID=376470 RepID=UPI00040AB74B|nr:Do family serine endopeptidase [Olivibacter sitiensis]
MRKLGLTVFAAALIGGGVAIGGYKLLEDKQKNQLTFEERQQMHLASNPSGLVSSAGEVDFTQAAAAVAPAVVHIKTTYEGKGSSGRDPFQDMFEEFFGAPRSQRQRRAQPATASGSGVIISADGYIITNNHVVEDADKISVEMTNKKVFDAKVIGRDPNTDLALIKINATGLPIVKLGDSDNVQIGEWVLAVGYPLGLQSTVTAGIVSAKGQNLGILSQQQQQQQGFGQSDEIPVSSAIESYIQTDAAINKGNSGGALVNAKGELIGINAALASPTGYYTGYGYAIPVNLAKKIADDFVKFGTVKRGFVGVTFTELDAAKAKELNVSEINGLYVQDIVPKGGAADAGIQKGDVITKVDGKDIYSSSDLQETVGRMRPGDKVKLTYSRAGKEKDVTVTLKENESASSSSKEESAAKRSGTEIYNKLGAGFVPVTDAQKKKLGIESGVVVSEVRRGGWFEYYGVSRGLVITHVNGKAVNNVDQVESALGESKNNIVKLQGIDPEGGRFSTSFPVQ